MLRIWKFLIRKNEETGGGLAVGLAVGLIFGLVAGLFAGLAAGLAAGLVAGLVAGLFFGLFVGLAVGPVDGLVAALVTEMAAGLAGISGGVIGALIAFGITTIGWWVVPILGGVGLAVWRIIRKIRRSKVNQPTRTPQPRQREISRPAAELALPETISQALGTIRAFLESAERLPLELRGDAGVLIEQARDFLASRAKHLLDQQRVLSARQHQLEPESGRAPTDIRSLEAGRSRQELKDIEAEFTGAAETVLKGWQELLEAEKRMSGIDRRAILDGFGEALSVTREMLETSGYREPTDELAEEIEALGEPRVTPLDPARQLPKAASGSD